MIRKVFFALVVLLLLGWIITAHIVKSKAISFINELQTENVKLSYDSASLAGFPWVFAVKLDSPRIIATNQSFSREISSDYVKIDFNYVFDKIKLDFGENLHYSANRDSELLEYKLKSKGKIYVYINFIKNLYKLEDNDVLDEILDKIIVKHPSLIAFNDQKEMFELSSLLLNLKKSFVEENKYFSLKMKGDYNSLSSGNKIQNANLHLESKYIIYQNQSELEDIQYERKIEFNKAKLNLDETSCALKGYVNLSRENLPNGKISVEITDYDEMVDLVIPDDFIFSKPYIKKMIARAASIEFSNEINSTINFDINFTNKGVSLGRISLFGVDNE